MSEFTPLALSRARFYCKGSPVQFVCVELLRMEETGSVVVTLTFKNVYSQPLTAFTAHFRCKNRQGEVIVDDDFVYDGLNVPEGGTFGCDDAVFVSDEALGGVDVSLVAVEYGAGRRHSLQQCTPVPLQKQQKLPEDRAARVNQLLQYRAAEFMPVNVTDGWQCTCGAFNYGVGKGAVQCSECGVTKANLIQALKTAAQPQQPPQGDSGLGFNQPAAAASAPQDARTIQYSVRTIDATTRVMPPVRPAAQSVCTAEQAGANATRAFTQSERDALESAADAVSLMQPQTAEFILRWLPLITGGACAVYVAAALLLHTLL